MFNDFSLGLCVLWSISNFATKSWQFIFCLLNNSTVILNPLKWHMYCLDLGIMAVWVSDRSWYTVHDVDVIYMQALLLGILNEKMMWTTRLTRHNTFKNSIQINVIINSNISSRILHHPWWTETYRECREMLKAKTNPK